MEKSASGWWKGLAKYLVGALLLTFVISSNWTALQEKFQQTPQWGAFFASLGCYLVILVTQYLRWFLLVRALDLPFTPRNAIRLGMVGTFYNTFLPGSVGGDFVKAYFIAKDQPSRRAAAVATVIADRLVGLFGLILFAGAVGGTFWMMGDEKITKNDSLQLIVKVCAALATGGVLGYLAIGFIPEQRADRFTERLLSLKRGGPALAELWYAVRQYRKRPRTVLATVAISAVSHTAMMLGFHYAVYVFPDKNPALLATLGEHFVIVPIGSIVQALIPVPGGLGASELTFGGLYGILRPDMKEAAMSVGTAGRLTLRLMEWFLGLICYIAYLNMKAELPVPTENEEPVIPPIHEEAPAGANG